MQGCSLSWLPFPEEVAFPNLLDRIISFHIHQFANPIPNSVSAGDAVEIRARVDLLSLKPFAGARRVLIFEPPVRIGDANAVQDFCDSIDRSERWSAHQLRHGELRSVNCIASRFILLARLRK